MIVMGISLSFANALIITEVEPNPAGDDKGNEWVELYSEGEINLGGYKLVSNKGKVFNLSGTFTGYYVITFPSLWLVNANESVSLKIGNEIVYQTPILKDDKNDERAWNLCGSEWKFIESSRGEVNVCEGNPGSSNQQTNNQQATGNGQNNASNAQNSASENNVREEFIPLSGRNETVQNSNARQKIVLNNPVEEEETFVSKKEKVRLGVVYAFAGLCVLIIVLLSTRKI